MKDPTILNAEIERRQKSTFHASCLLVVFSADCLMPAWATEFQAKVIRVLDGDTIEVLHDGHPQRIRLNGADCPEKSQAFGSKAKLFTSEFCFGKVVAVDDADMIVTVGL